MVKLLLLVDQCEVIRREYDYGDHNLPESTNVVLGSPEGETQNIDGGDIQQTHFRPIAAGLIFSRSGLVSIMLSDMEKQ